MKTETELFENALDTTSVNGKKLREYINKNYISNSVLEKIRSEIFELWQNEPCTIEHGCLNEILEIIDKYRAESEE